MSGTSFQHGEAQDGAAVFLTDMSTVDVSESFFCDNDAESSGGAVTVYSGVGGTWTRNRFARNAAGWSGSAVMVDSGVTAALVNNAFVDNGTAGRPGATVGVEGGSIEFVNNAVIGSQTQGVAGITALQASKLHHNGWYENGQDVAGGSPGAGAVSAAPRFVAASSDLSCDELDLGLEHDSPYVDAGDPSLEDDDGSTSDIGAYGGATD